MSPRPSKDEYYLNIAKAISERGTCLRRRVGAIIVINDRIVSTGYVGAARGEEHCDDRGECIRKELRVPSGMFYEICRSVHAEENAIVNAASTGATILGASLYIYSAPISKEYYPEGQEPTPLYLPCYRCKKLIINAGLEKVIIAMPQKESFEKCPELSIQDTEIKIYDKEDIRKMLREDEKKIMLVIPKFFSEFKK